MVQLKEAQRKMGSSTTLGNGVSEKLWALRQLFGFDTRVKVHVPRIYNLTNLFAFMNFLPQKSLVNNANTAESY
jgi:hypothetical protein